MRNKMKHDDFINENWRAVLEHHGLADFDALWDYQVEWFEEPNRRRGGWSGVARCEFEDPAGGMRSVFLKRQENHNCKSFLRPGRGIPTFHREFNNINHYRKNGVPTLEPVFFAYRIEPGKQRCILVTEELTGFTPLDKLVEQWQQQEPPTREIRLAVLDAVIDLTRRMHDRHIQHNCFCPKHLFIRPLSPDKAEARVIDLEKSKWSPFRTWCASRDLYMLNYQSQWWSNRDRLRFFIKCQHLSRLTPAAKKMWRKIALRTYSKGRVAK
jgi:hypothetical protein